MRDPFHNLPAQARPFHGIPAAAVQTYQLAAPKATHFRPATCAEVECPHHLNGWATTVAAGSDDEDLVRALIREHRYVHTPNRQEGGFVQYVFAAGQTCFRGILPPGRGHVVPLGREPIYVVRHGDWRGNPTGVRRIHTRGVDWVEDFGEHQERLVDQHNRG